MIWLFERGDRVVRLVTRFDTETREYVLDVEWSDGLSKTERFRDCAEFGARAVELEKRLEAEQWKQAGAPRLIVGDWWMP
jgi:hypothetical protein